MSGLLKTQLLIKEPQTKIAYEKAKPSKKRNIEKDISLPKVTLVKPKGRAKRNIFKLSQKTSKP